MPDTCLAEPEAPAPDAWAAPGLVATRIDDVGEAGVSQARPRSRADSWWVLGAVCLAGLMMPLSFTGPAVATPAISRDLGGNPATLGWVVNAFVLSFGSFVMAAGSLADQLGRKRLFRAGVAGFILLSVVIGLAPSLLTLIALRGVQGITAAVAMAAGAAALAQEFDGAARTRAFSLLGTTFGVGLAFGPIWSGFLIERLGWRSVFLTGAAIGVVVLTAGVPRMRESRDPGAAGIDWPGTLTFTTMLLLLTLGIVQGPQHGWTSAFVISLLLGAALLCAIFLRIERTRRAPMLDLTFFRFPRFLGAQLLPIATAFCFVVLLIALPIRLIGVEGIGEMEAGVLMLPLCAPMVVVPLLGALLTRWVPASHLSSLGLALAAVGLVWLSAIDPGRGAAAMALPLLVVGIGSGLPWGLMDDLSVSVVPKERAGMAIGIFATMRVAGEAVALAIVGAMLVALTQSSLQDTLAASAAQATATQVASTIASGASAASAAASGPTGSAPASVSVIANAVAGGRLDAALTAAPHLSRETLMLAYAGAFQTMLRAVAGVTLIAAALAFVLLRRPDPQPASLPVVADALPLRDDLPASRVGDPAPQGNLSADFRLRTLN